MSGGPTPVNVIQLKSRNYGLPDNTIKVKIEDGTNAGKRLSVMQGIVGYGADDVARSVMSVSYGGDEASATITIDATNCTLKAPDNAAGVVIPLANFTTVQDLVDRINVVPGFTAEVLGEWYTHPTVNGLDFIAATDCLTAPVEVTADLQAVVDWFNSDAQPLVQATRTASVGQVPDNIDWTYLTGGSDGVVTNTQWANGFSELQKLKEQLWITPISSDSAIHAMANAHAMFCSINLRRERRAICGTAAGTSDASAIAAAKALNSDRTSLVHIGYYDYNAAGQLALRAPYMTAALISAMFAGSSPGTPMTNKAMRVQGLERDLIVPLQTDPLIRGGVLCVENTDQGYKVVQSISTWLVNRKYNKVEQSCGAATDYVVREVRAAVDVLRGQKGNQFIPQRAVSIAETTLKELAKPEPQGPGALAGDANSPAYRNITATLEGDVTRLQFECSPVIPNNFVLVTVYVVPYSGTATAA